ncbi:MAG: protease [Nitrosomonas sp.]|nr:MAG: protease [Nitrosomonas sp.]
MLILNKDDLTLDRASDLGASVFGGITDVVATTATGENNIDGLLSGIQWADRNISFSFPDSFSNDYEAGYANAASHAASFQVLNAIQQGAARNWVTGGFNKISMLNQNELTGANDRDATIRLATSNDPATAYAYYPGSTVEGGDIWFGTTYNYTNPIVGTYAYYTFGHELGHALGLKHGHETGGVRGVALNADRDSMEFSIMTYRSYIGAPTDYVYNAEGGYAQTLMMYDIAAIQHMYGARFDTNSGNSNYTFSTASGEMFINGDGQGIPYTNTIFRTIWDGGGIDTFDFSNYSTNLTIDLTPGSWTDLDVGGNFQRAYLGNGHYARAQVFNALQFNNDVRSLIENAQGGSGNDTITGNAANNTLHGGAGNDTIGGSSGNDTLIGWSGADMMLGGSGDDNYFVENVGDIVTEKLNEGNDSVSVKLNYTLPVNVENLTLTGILGINGTGNDFDNVITGNSAANQLNGQAGNDTLIGGGGNDILTGWSGADSMSGGAGNDTYFVENVNDVVTETFNQGIDTVSTRLTHALQVNVENLILTGTSAINGTGNGLANNITGNNSGNQLNSLSGNDRLTGKGGKDTLTGGPGADKFVFDTVIGASNIDTITDFISGTDKILLDDDIFTELGITGTTAGVALTANKFHTGAFAQDTLDRIIYNSTTGVLYYDANGSVSGQNVQIALIGTNTHPALSATDFQVIV